MREVNAIHSSSSGDGAHKQTDLDSNIDGAEQLTGHGDERNGVSSFQLHPPADRLAGTEEAQIRTH